MPPRNVVPRKFVLSSIRHTYTYLHTACAFPNIYLHLWKCITHVTWSREYIFITFLFIAIEFTNFHVHNYLSLTKRGILISFFVFPIDTRNRVPIAGVIKIIYFTVITASPAVECRYFQKHKAKWINMCTYELNYTRINVCSVYGLQNMELA